MLTLDLFLVMLQMKNYNYHRIIIYVEPAGSQYLIVYCLWIPKPNPFTLNNTQSSIDFSVDSLDTAIIIIALNQCLFVDYDK